MKSYWMAKAVLNKWVTPVVVILLLGAVATTGTAQTQQPPLERSITVQFNQESIEYVLIRISKDAGFTFSYNPVILEGISPVTASFDNRTIREVLNEVLQGKVLYKEKNNYIILTKAPSSQKKTEDEALTISGYIVHSETLEKLPAVSIYDKGSLTSTVTNEYGFFKLKLDKPQQTNVISVSKRNFYDTTFSVVKGTVDLITVPLAPKPSVVRPAPLQDLTPVDSVAIQPAVRVPVETSIEQKQSQINITNIQDTLYREYQVSLVPFVGTNSKLSGNVINDYSFNVLGGYSLGVRKFELGGLFNLNRGDVGKVQIAGIFNANYGSAEGLQLAGNVNLNRGRMDGVQLAGNVNLNLDSATGPQIAGLVNMNVKSARGVQIAGLSNIQIGNYEGPQIAGLLNVATGTVDGGQFAGLVNYGKNVRGTQLALLNIADSVRGVPIGLLSLVNSGYHKIEISADEIFYTNLAFRTGVRQFYNILTAGMKPDAYENVSWTIGYGIGTAPKITKWLYLNFDLTSNQISQGTFTPAVNLLNKLYMGFDFQVAKKFSITTGVTLNGYITDNTYSEYPPLFTDYMPNIIVDEDIGVNAHLQMWWGGKFGIRFL